MSNLKIAGGAYSLEAPVAIQECINLFPEVEQHGAQEQIVLRRFPGRLSFSNPTGACRGLKKMNGVLYGVYGTLLYSISSTGTATSLGTIAGSNQVSMATDGTNLVIVNGTTTLYRYNGSFFATTPTNFLTADKVYYLDTYFVFHKTDTNVFFISNPADPATYTGTDLASKEGQPDKIVSIIVSHRDLILLGQETTEVWQNTGNTDFTFQRQSGNFMERGVIGLHTSVEMDNSIYYLGNDRVVYTNIGYRPTVISTHALEKWLSEQDSGTLDSGIGMTITYQGHYWYILSFSTGTWAYDSTSSIKSEERQWFQLQSWGYDNWRVTAVENCYGKILMGDLDGYVTYLDKDTFTENGTRMLKRRTTQYYHNERKPISCKRLELGFKEGVANSSVTDPKVFLEISRDWGRTWGNRRERSLGELGEYTQKAIWRRNGKASNFTFRWSVTDNVDVTFTGGYGEFS